MWIPEAAPWAGPDALCCGCRGGWAVEGVLLRKSLWGFFCSWQDMLKPNPFWGSVGSNYIPCRRGYAPFQGWRDLLCLHPGHAHNAHRPCPSIHISEIPLPLLHCAPEDPRGLPDNFDAALDDSARLALRDSRVLWLRASAGSRRTCATERAVDALSPAQV